MEPGIVSFLNSISDRFDVASLQSTVLVARC
jgi:hypothetical protein